MDFKKIGKALLFPRIAIMIILIPIATAFLVYSMVFLGSKSVLAITSYVIAFYTLAVWCIRIPHMINLLKTFKSENKYVLIWQDDAHLRVKISLYGTFIWNVAYAILQLILGVRHQKPSVWLPHAYRF